MILDDNARPFIVLLVGVYDPRAVYTPPDVTILDDDAVGVVSTDVFPVPPLATATIPVTFAAVPLILVWSPVLVPLLEPEKLDATIAPVTVNAPAFVNVNLVVGVAPDCNSKLVPLPSMTQV